MIRMLASILLSFLFFVLLDLAIPGFVCNRIEETKTLFKKEKMIITNDNDTLIFNKKTRMYEQK